jgi:hypothetical protein
MRVEAHKKTETCAQMGTLVNRNEHPQKHQQEKRTEKGEVFNVFSETRFIILFASFLQQNDAKC